MSPHQKATAWVTSEEVQDRLCPTTEQTMYLVSGITSLLQQQSNEDELLHREKQQLLRIFNIRLINALQACMDASASRAGGPCECGACRSAREVLAAMAATESQAWLQDQLAKARKDALLEAANRCETSEILLPVTAGITRKEHGALVALKLASELSAMASTDDKQTIMFAGLERIKERLNKIELERINEPR